MEANKLPPEAATLTDGDWHLVQTLWPAGGNDAGLDRLLRLRARYRATGAATDGLQDDPPARRLGATSGLHEEKERHARPPHTGGLALSTILAVTVVLLGLTLMAQPARGRGPRAH